MAVFKIPQGQFRSGEFLHYGDAMIEVLKMVEERIAERGEQVLRKGVVEVTG